MVEGEDQPEYDDLTDFERLHQQVTTRILLTGKATLKGFDLQVDIDYTDR